MKYIRGRNLRGGGQTATANCTTGDPSNVSSTGATLSDSFLGEKGI